jgi:hypothetical protein
MLEIHVARQHKRFVHVRWSFELSVTSDGFRVRRIASVAAGEHSMRADSVAEDNRNIFVRLMPHSINCCIYIKCLRIQMFCAVNAMLKQPAGIKHQSDGVRKDTSQRVLPNIPKRLFKYQQVRAPTLPETLSPKRTGNLIRPPINLYLSSIYILIDSDHTVVYIVILILALLEHLEDKIATDGRIVCVAKVLVDALLEGFDTLAELFGVVCVGEFLEDGA